MQFIDPRHKSQLQGVGQKTTLGIIFKLSLEIQGKFFILSASVLKDFHHDMILGLDMMKRHNCVLDLG